MATTELELVRSGASDLIVNAATGGDYRLTVSAWVSAGLTLAPGTDESRRTLALHMVDAAAVRRALEPVARAMASDGYVDERGDAIDDVLPLAQGTDGCLFVFAQSRRESVSDYALGAGLRAGAPLPSGRRAPLVFTLLVSHVYYYRDTPRLCLQLVRVDTAKPRAALTDDAELTAARLEMVEATEAYRRAMERLGAAERRAAERRGAIH